LVKCREKGGVVRPPFLVLFKKGKHKLVLAKQKGWERKVEPIFIILLISGLIVFLLMAGGGNVLRFIGQGMIKLAIGALLLFFVNAFGGQMDIHVPINILTAVISGFLGVFGVAALVIIDFMIL
jgi:inhibitor of the pro-sigma K processing machinery